MKGRLLFSVILGLILFALAATSHRVLGQETKAEATDGTKKFIPATECGVCHPAHYREWAGSPHSHAHTSLAFQGFQKKLVTKSGLTVREFCVRCHTPVGTTLGERALLPDNQRAPVSLEGVTCVVCHSIGRLYGLVSGEIPLSPDFPFYGPLYGPEEAGAKPGADDTVVADIPHGAKRFAGIQNSRLCGHCHDVLGTNMLRIEEAFSEWRNSPWAAEGVSCQDCHMSPDPGRPVPREQWPKDHIADPNIFPDLPKRIRTNHAFTGPDHQLIVNSAKERLNLNDEEYKRFIDNYENQRLRLLRNALTMSVDSPAKVAPGSKLKVVATITNVFGGHQVPTGFTAERQFWLEVLLRDAKGKLLYATGDLDHYGDLRDGHSLDVEHGKVAIDRDLFNLQAKFIVRNFAGTESENLDPVNRLLSPVPVNRPASGLSALMGSPFGARVSKKGIPPRSSKKATYSIRVPEGTEGPLSLSVRLRHRHLPPHFLISFGLGDLVDKIRTLDLYTHKAEIRLATE